MEECFWHVLAVWLRILFNGVTRRQEDEEGDGCLEKDMIFIIKRNPFPFPSSSGIRLAVSSFQLASHEDDGVRKEKERLTAAQFFCGCSGKTYEKTSLIQTRPQEFDVGLAGKRRSS